MNWKELYALVNENIKNAVSGLYKPAGDVTFAELPELSQSVLGYTYTVTDAFTTDNRFTDYDTETQTGHSFPADTEVAVIVTGTTENPVYMFNVMGGIMDGYATKGDLDNYVEKEAGKSLSTNDYTNADKALVQDSPITVSATGSDLTLSTSSGNINALTVYGKSEVVDGSIKSAGEGWTTVDLGTLNWVYNTSSQTPIFSTSLNEIGGISNSNNFICPKYKPNTSFWIKINNDMCIASGSSNLNISNFQYTNATDFKTAMSGVILAYKQATPTNNTIAIKTDNGSGINGTMAVFETGTPLYGVDETVRDVMMWDGIAGTATKKCGEVDLGTLNWNYFATSNTPIFYSPLSSINGKPNSINMLCPLYTPESDFWNEPNNDMKIATSAGDLFISNSQYTSAIDFKSAMSGVKLIYELATPTIEPLTASENASIAGLRTFAPQTQAQNNASTDMTVEAYAGTANGKAVQELKQDVQSEIAAQTAAQLALIAVPYDSTLTYNTGDYVTEGGKLYKCSTPVSTAEPFDPTKWTATTVMAEITA